jgi:hypothetical protein
MTATCVLWVRARPDYEPLFSILDGLCLDSERRYWIKRKIMGRNISDIHVYSGQIGTSVEIWFPKSHKTLTYAEENIQ